jgi:Ser/Thr protein kinase RdoA (MazF antagonist)
MDAVIMADSCTEASEHADVALDPAERWLLTAALRGFGLAEPLEARPVANGLMNRNWQVRTAEGTWAVKQILDVDAQQARRQHRVTRALAGLGLAVPPPRATPEGDTLVEVPGLGVFAVLPWMQGVHRGLCRCRCYADGLGLWLVAVVVVVLGSA